MNCLFVTSLTGLKDLLLHAYHLLRYETAIFSQAALEKLQDSLKATAPKRKAEVA